MKVNLGTLEITDELRTELRRAAGGKGLATRAEILEIAHAATNAALARAVAGGGSQAQDVPASEDTPGRFLARLQCAARAALDSLRKSRTWLTLNRGTGAVIDVAEALEVLERVAGVVGRVSEPIPEELADAVGGRNDARDAELAELDRLELEAGEGGRA